MNLIKRIDQLERELSIKEMPILDVHIISCPEQIDHPERFDKILVSDETAESGLRTRMFEFERKK